MGSRGYNSNSLIFFFFSLFLFLPFLSSAAAPPVVLIFSNDDLKVQEEDSSPDDEEPSEFPDSATESEDELDPGSWRPIVDSYSPFSNASSQEFLFSSGIRRLISASSSGDLESLEEAAAEIGTAAALGFPHAQSAMGFLHSTGCAKKQNAAKALLYHHFAAEGGNMQSKMALAYTYLRQEMYEKAVKLYAELAEIAVSSFMISKDHPVIEPIRIHSGTEENKEALRKSRGEEDEDFQITEYQAQKGNAAAMYKIGVFYYFGLRGLRCDHAKAMYWFLRAVEKGEPRSMELLGEIYARGAGVERNYTKALEWLTLASRHQHFSAYNGLGYLYVKGYGVDKKNATKAKEYFKKAAENEEPGGHYNLGVLYLKGIGVKKDVKVACRYFITAANAGQPKAFYQLGKMFETGIAFRKNLHMAASLYKLVAERGPWSSLSRWLWNHT